MLPNPRPANIPGLFQFPPSLEPHLAPYDEHHRAQQIFASSSRIPVGTPTGAMRHNHTTPYQQLDPHHPPYGNPAPHPHPTDARVPTSSFAHHHQHPRPTLNTRSSTYSPHPHPHPTHRSHPRYQWAPQHVHAQQNVHGSHEGAVPVKLEEGPEDSAMWVSDDTPVASAYDTLHLQDQSPSPQHYQQLSYSPQYTEEPVMMQSPVDAPMQDCKQEDMDHGFVEQPYSMQYADEGASQNWDNAAGFYPPQPPDYYPTDAASEPSTGLAAGYPHPYSPGMYVDSPSSPDSSYPVAMPDMYSVPSLHSVRPLPTGPTRSYTLEGAITPVSPRPLPVKRKSSSPPPMGSLLPPSPPAQSQTQVQAPETPAAASKRPRGRPRKNPASISADDADSHVIPPPPSAPVPVPVVNPAPAPAPVDGPASGQAMFKLDMAVATGESGDAGKEPEKKKPIMACLFCRERKIACGPPPPGGPQRCNQCTRRGLVCEYPKESRRGQHKRGARAAKVEAHAASSASNASSPTSSSDKAGAKGKSKPKVDTKNLPQLQAASSSQVQSAVDVLMRSSSPLTPIPSPSMGARSLPNSPARLPAASRRNPVSLASSSTHPSPAMPLASPTNAAHPAPAVERKSRPEKVELMREGKERSRSRQREQPLGDTQVAAARRAALRQQVAQAQKRRASAGSAGGEHAPGIVRLPVAGMVAPPGSFAGHPAGMGMQPQVMRG
ncbi:hypothetical protein C8T65DRAFT_654595 [Cerioporus squamosus]|nr:hypothetical protein C8T65DRAFT_654595 [Cerioporus squamosus]